MAVISIRFNSEEENIIKEYVKSKGISISQFIKEVLIEKIEDEYDLEMCKEYLEGKKTGNLITIPFEEAVKEWDLE